MNSNSNSSKLFDCIKQLPEAAIEKLLTLALAMVNVEDINADCCPYCGEKHFVRYGKKRGKQRFLCKSCARTFVTTTHTILSMSHQPAYVWKEVVSDTLHGYSIDHTADRLALSHPCVFSMRHKILAALQDVIASDPVILSQVSELDETFVLECYKGKELPPNVDRPARKHGAKAQKRGISNEYICINTGIQRDGGAVVEAVNRAKPDSSELEQVYNGHLGNDSLILCDGLKSYNILKELADCTVKDINTANEDEKCFFNLNTVNNLHSFIKERYNHYRGVATKYLNRYNALFTLAWRQNESLLADLCTKLFQPGTRNYYHTIKNIREEGLLVL